MRLPVLTCPVYYIYDYHCHVYNLHSVSFSNVNYNTCVSVLTVWIVCYHIVLVHKTNRPLLSQFSHILTSTAGAQDLLGCPELVDWITDLWQMAIEAETQGGYPTSSMPILIVANEVLSSIASYQ